MDFFAMLICVVLIAGALAPSVMVFADISSQDCRSQKPWRLQFSLRLLMISMAAVPISWNMTDSSIAKQRNRNAKASQ